LRQELKDKADEKGTRDSDEGVRFRVFLSSQNFTSGMWLLVYMAHKIYKLAPAEFFHCFPMDVKFFDSDRAQYRGGSVVMDQRR